jgi:hypothetical protein
VPVSYSGTSGDLSWDFHGIPEMERAIDELIAEVPAAGQAITLELGLLFEYYAKAYSPVRTGRLRASWGHFTPQDIRDPNVTGEARSAAVFDEPTRSNWTVVVGTRVRYAPIQNYRFGHYMVERAMQQVIDEAPDIAHQYLDHMRSSWG